MRNHFHFSTRLLVFYLYLARDTTIYLFAPERLLFIGSPQASTMLVYEELADTEFIPTVTLTGVGLPTTQSL